MPTSAAQATASSARGASPASQARPAGFPPSTPSTTTLSGQGLASSRSPITSTWRTARAKSPRCGASRRSTLRPRRSVPTTPLTPPAARPARPAAGARCGSPRGEPHRAPAAGRAGRAAGGVSGVVGTLRLGRNVLRRLAPHRGLFALAVLQVLVIGLLELAKPWPLKVVVDGVLGGKPAGLAWLAGLAPRALLAVACAALVGIYALLGLLAVTSNYATISVGQRMVNDFRSELYAHLQRLSLAFHSRREVGDLLYRLTADTFAIQTLTMNGFFPVLTSAMLLCGMVVVMLRLDVTLTLIALGVVPLLFVTIAGLSRRITALATDARLKESALWGVAQRAMGAIRVVQAFTTEDLEHRRFLASSGESLAANLRLYTSQTVYGAVVNVLIAVGTAAVLWTGAAHVLAGRLSVGEVLVFASYLASLYAPINSLTQ